MVKKNLDEKNKRVMIIKLIFKATENHPQPRCDSTMDLLSNYKTLVLFQKLLQLLSTAAETILEFRIS